jgi:tetraacyldisaccharide 4'-kinase
MKAPAFWGPGQGGVMPMLLAPAAWIYGAAVVARTAMAPSPWRAPVPVICVGNVTAGGSGKTPVAIALAERLTIIGRTPHFLTRGYGGSERGPLRVDPAHHTAADVGDEALLLATHCPTWIGADRARSARLATEAGADVLVMDDGLQNRTLEQDLGVLVFDGGFGIGNGRLLPAGPLREPLATALGRVGAAIIIGNDETGIGERLPRGLPALKAHVTPGPEAEALSSARVVAFAGIGRPDKFFETLAATGAELVERIPFPDHHPFSAADLAGLTARARQLNARLVTTEKDWMRLDAEAREIISRLTISLRWKDQAAFDRIVEQTIGGARNAG